MFSTAKHSHVPHHCHGVYLCYTHYIWRILYSEYLKQKMTQITPTKSNMIWKHNVIILQSNVMACHHISTYTHCGERKNKRATKRWSIIERGRFKEEDDDVAAAVDDDEEKKKQKKLNSCTQMSELAMGQQQKRKSHHDNRALIITVIIHFEFTIRQYIMYLYISTHTHKIGIVDEDVQLENWQRSTKQQCSIQQKEAHRERESGWAHKCASAQK